MPLLTNGSKTAASTPDLPVDNFYDHSCYRGRYFGISRTIIRHIAVVLSRTFKTIHRGRYIRYIADVIEDATLTLTKALIPNVTAVTPSSLIINGGNSSNGWKSVEKYILLKVA